MNSNRTIRPVFSSGAFLLLSLTLVSVLFGGCTNDGYYNTFHTSLGATLGIIGGMVLFAWFRSRRRMDRDDEADSEAISHSKPSR